MRFDRLTTSNDGVFPFWLTGCIIRGFEGEGDGDGGDGNTGDSDDRTGDGTDEGDGDNTSDPKDEDVAGLKSSLEKERLNAKRAEKERKALQKRLDDLDAKDKSVVDKATADATKATEKAARLATKLLETSVEQAIIKGVNAKDMPKFADLDDVLKLIDRGDFGVEQDEDDPSDVTIDSAKVKAAILKLARDKKHLLVGANNGDEDPSGGRFGGGGNGKTKMTDAAYRELYPSLN